MEKRIDLVTKQLDVLQKAADLANDSNFSNEEVEIIKRQIISGTSKLIEAGVSTPELDQRKTNEPRELLSPEPKLLAGFTVETEGRGSQSQNSDDDNSAKSWLDSLSSDEIEKLKSVHEEDQKKKEEKQK